MAKRVKRYRVPNAAMATLIGQLGELIVNLTNNSLHVHDGVTPGGHELGRADGSNMNVVSLSQNGILTAAQYSTILTGISDNAAAITALASGKADEVAGTAGHLPVLDGAGQMTSLGMPFFSENQRLLFSNALSPGWTLVTSWNDRALIVTNDANDLNELGGTWTVGGLTMPHTHSMQNHTHTDGSLLVTLVDGNWGDDNGTMPTANPGAISVTGSTGGPSTASTGAASASTVSSNGAWRPLYQKVIWGARNAAA